MRGSNLADEVRATAERRKQASGGTPSQSQLREGVKQMASRFAVMFPSLPEDTVEAVVSEFFRADAQITRELLADRAIAALVEMTLADGSPQTITSFEPPSFCGDSQPEAVHPVVPGATSAAPSAPPLSAMEPTLAASQATHRRDGANAHADLSTMVEMAEISYVPSAPAASFDIPAGDADLDSMELERIHWEDLDNFLDSQLALLLTLPDDALAPCVQTLASILDRIVDDPGNARVRRLRYGNKTFAAKVGCHEAAVELLRLAGFQHDPGESEDDRGLVFCGDFSELSAFGRVRDCIHGVAEDIPGLQQPSKAASASRQGTSSVTLAGEDRAAREERRNRTAAITEQRLKDPRKFRQEALERGSANSGYMVIPKRPATHTGDSTLSSQRQSRHFNLSDIDRMRVDDEIAGTTNYAEEYRLATQSTPAHDYSTLVARGYDPVLISRQALDGTNRYRASKGLSPCRWHEGISRIAAEHAASMASGAASFSHDGFNARVARFPPNRGAGENLALSQGVANVAETAVSGWIKSPGHEKNLRGNWNVCGIGTARSANGTFYTTQLFALCL